MTRAVLIPVDWLAWSNPVAIWWGALLAVSAVNVGLFLWLRRHCRRRAPAARTGLVRIELLLLLCAAYVFGCAFRAVLPRADVQRICLFDTWLSSVAVGRSVATVAELCFAAQWAVVLYQLGRLADSDTARAVAKAIVPLILVAECCSWYAVVTTDYLGNAVENSLWTVTFLLIGVALLRLFNKFHGVVQLAIVFVAAGIAGYVMFMGAVDLPMYFTRWQAELASDKDLLGLVAGLRDVSTHWDVTRDFAEWKPEIAWMSLYFSLAVWASLALGAFGLVHDHLPRYCRHAPRARRPVPMLELKSGL